MKATDNLCSIVDIKNQKANARRNVNVDRAFRNKFIQKSVVVHVWYALELLNCWTSPSLADVT